MPRSSHPRSRVARAVVPAWALMVLASLGGCGSSQADELEAIKARLDKLEAEHARLMADKGRTAGTETEVEERLEARESAHRQTESLKSLVVELSELQKEQERLEKERAALGVTLEAAKSEEAKRRELEAKLAELDRAMAENEETPIEADEGGRAREKGDPLGGL